MAFYNGASLDPLPPGASKHETVRYLNIYEDGDFDEGRFATRASRGWGWSPVTWQGWVVSLLFIAAIVAAGSLLSSTTRTVVLILLVVGLLLVSYLTSGPPGTTWGKRR